MGILTALFGFSTQARATTPEADHRALTIYQIMVASFIHSDDGSVGYTAMWGPDGNTKNGNLRGIIEALPHIKSLGVNAIWMTPIFDSSEARGGEKLQATGYFTNNFFAIDPHFGTEADLRELVDKAHSMGMYVILDGVFGHHGGVTTPSPSSFYIDNTVSESDRGPQGGSGNVSYPNSLPYFKEVATWWMDNYQIDGWRLDQAYQATQGGHNYWIEIRGAVEQLCAERRARGEQWGTLGYMVGEDWGTAEVINQGVYRDGGLLSAFDFDGKERISGAMQDISSEGLVNGYQDIITTLSAPTKRGYLNDEVIPNLFLSNHDGYRLADHFEPTDPYLYEKLMQRHAILALYSGPITLYYGDEYGDFSKYTTGGQKDNIARSTGHLGAYNREQQRLCDYVSEVMHFRADNPAMWRGEAACRIVKTAAGDVLIVVKKDTESDNTIVAVFSDHYDLVPVDELGSDVFVKPYKPEMFKIK